MLFRLSFLLLLLLLSTLPPTPTSFSPPPPASSAPPLTPSDAESAVWSLTLPRSPTPYISPLVSSLASGGRKIAARQVLSSAASSTDPLWSQVRLEAEAALEADPMIGSTVFSAVLSQPSLFSAATEHVANAIGSPELSPNILAGLFRSSLTTADRRNVSLDVLATASRSPSTGSALNVLLLHPGFFALLTHRLAHRLFLQGRTGLAFWLQSAASAKFQADIHPGATIGGGVYLSVGAGVVIGETAVVGDDCSILQGVTLGGTGRERGDRHPKLGRGVIVQDSVSILGNVKVGDGAVVQAKSIVLREVPALARVAGIPAKVQSYRFGGGGAEGGGEEGGWEREVEAALRLWEGAGGDAWWDPIAGTLGIAEGEEEELRCALRESFGRWGGGGELTP